MLSPTRKPPARPSPILPVLVAAFGGWMLAQAVAHDGRLLVPLLAVAALVLLPAAWGRWRMRRILMSGDVERVLGTWHGSIDRVPHRATMGPLLQATAYAAYGWSEAARQSLQRAVKGPAWEAALEQRLFVETLLDSFEGDRETAVRKASALESLPLPAAGPLARRRIASLRRGLGALARAFAHASRRGDGRALARAASASPLVHWAMRYAAAIVAIDQGRPGEVHGLLAGAPSWPRESAFHGYHHELLGRVAG